MVLDIFSKKFRQRRFFLFLQLTSLLKKPIRILDVGGTERFWKDMGFKPQEGVEVVLLNLSPQTPTLANFSAVQRDAKDLSLFKDKEFDVVFSNATLEHVGDFSAQKKAACEIRRVGKRYFVQVPSFWFLFEPHFLFPCFQFLPKSFQVSLMKNFPLGRFKKPSSLEEAIKIVDSIRLLRFSEMRQLFPEAKILTERFLLMPKSYIACFGWPEKEMFWRK